jgi:hypothetical protein
LPCHEVLVMELEKTSTVFFQHQPPTPTATTKPTKPMDNQSPDSGEGEGRKGLPQDRAGRKDEPSGSSRGGERRERSPAPRGDDRHQGWTWNRALHIIYHPRGCPVCAAYGQHIMQAEFSMDDEYIDTTRLREEEVELCQKKTVRYIDNLEDTDDHIRHLESWIKELEEELAGPREYEDRREGKWVQYNLSSESHSGIASPVLPVTMGELSAPSQQSTHMVMTVPLHHVQEDMNMDNGENAFPLLPAPSQPMAPTMGAPLFQRGANWMLALPMRQPSITRGSLFGQRMSRPMVIRLSAF